MVPMPPAAPEPAVLRPRGPFSLAAAAGFLHDFAPVESGAREDVLELVLRVAGPWSPVVAEVRAEGDAVAVRLHGPGAADPEAACAEVARVLALDVDATAFPAVGERDPVVGGPQRPAPGLRPVLFASPYEAAAWAVLSQRTRGAQAVALRRRLAADHGDAVTTPGGVRHAFPAPPAWPSCPGR